jgi:dsDNA-specific endonuclease/ATPase MutS2
MQRPDDMRERFQVLEDRVRQFIAMHESLKETSMRLAEENSRLTTTLEEERTRTKRMDEGYRNLKDQETSATRLQVERINTRINELVSEIDKNIKLIQV